MPANIIIGGNTTLTTANAPGAYVNVQQPAPSGAATAQYGLGVVGGTASWGPLNQLVYFSSVPQLFSAFGPQTNAAHDMVMENIMALSLNQNMAGYRISDGTDKQASGLLMDSSAVSGAAVLAYYSGTEGNNISVTMQAGSNTTASAPTTTVIVSRAGVAPQTETFPNLPSPGTGAFWATLQSAINNGVAGVRGPSLLISISAINAGSTHGPSLATVTLSGGTNGSNVNAANILGTDGTTGRTGIYNIRGSGATAFGVAGSIASTANWPTLASVSASEGVLGIDAVANGTSIATAITSKQTNNVYSDWLKIMTGDSWLNVNDPTLGLVVVSPIGLEVGLRCLLAPSASTLNKPSTGFGNSPFTSTTGYLTTYSQGQVAQIQNNGFDLVSSYLQGFYTNTTGCVTSTKQDQYPVLTAYIARNLGAIAQQFIGYTQSTQANDPTRSKVVAAFQHFFSTIQDQINGTPLIVCDSSNNTPTTVGEGFLIASVTVSYLGIVQQFVINLTAGSTVQIVTQQQP